MKPDFKDIAEHIEDRQSLEDWLEKMYNYGYEDGDLHGWEQDWERASLSDIAKVLEDEENDNKEE